MSQDNYLEMFREYAERTKEIRLLSTPNLDEIKDADEYGHVLTENFSKIGKLASENRRMINDVLKPMLSPDAELTDEVQSMLRLFDELLVKANSFEEVDVHLSEVIMSDYADVIKGHHLWYDCSKGYPSGFDTFKSPYKTVIDIVLAADCLDAATDTVGRSYNQGKSFEEFEQEIREGAGTHYAPFLANLLRRQEVRDDLVNLLSGGRDGMYRELYTILKDHSK